MNFEALNQHNIFPIKLDENFVSSDKKNYLLYFPLSGNITSASEAEAILLEKAISINDFEILPLNSRTVIKDLIEDNKINKPNFNSSDVNRMTILPTSKCNFSCSYCYSSDGRSNTSLNKNQIKTAIDYFIDPGRTKKKNLYISILGGGEPLLAVELTDFAFNYADERAKQFDFNLSFGLTTNGSIINNKIIDLIKTHKIDVGISFEILEQFQNSQRSNYEAVRRTIDILLNNKIFPVIKPIITKESIDYIPEMVEELALRFPRIREMKIQPVDSADYFSDSAEMRKYYNKLLQLLFVAQKTGRKYDINVFTVMSKFGTQLKDHYCGGEFSLTPGGQISICHRFSSENENHFDELNIGSVLNNHTVDINEKKFTSIMFQNSILNPRCENCFIKFHCSGGCIAQSTIYSEEMFEEICRFNRAIVKHELQKSVDFTLT